MVKTLDAVPVAADDVSGEPDPGFRVAMGTLNLFRPNVGAFAVGMVQAALDATLDRIRQRDAFCGKLKDLRPRRPPPTRSPRWPCARRRPG